MVGVGRADITPVTGVYKGGWSCTCAKAIGQQERLYARVIVLQEGGQKVALVTEDLFALSAGMIRDAAALLPGLGFSEQNIIDSATHTHSSQSGYMNFSGDNLILPEQQQSDAVRGHRTPAGPGDVQLHDPSAGARDPPRQRRPAPGRGRLGSDRAAGRHPEPQPRARTWRTTVSRTRAPTAAASARTRAATPARSTRRSTCCGSTSTEPDPRGRCAGCRWGSTRRSPTTALSTTRTSGTTAATTRARPSGWSRPRSAARATCPPRRT